MAQEIGVDGDVHAVNGKRLGMQPGVVSMPGNFALATLAQEHDVRNHLRALPLEGLRGQADRAEEIGLLGEGFA